MGIYDEYNVLQLERVDFLILMQVGEFFEIFGENAKFVSKELGITLSQKGIGDGKTIAMCGFPKKSYDIFIQKLLRINLKLAFASEYFDDLNQRFRKIDKLCTPGTIIDNELLPNNEENNIIIFLNSNDILYITICDLTRGFIEIINLPNTENNIDFICKMYNPREILLQNMENMFNFIKNNYEISITELNILNIDKMSKLLEISKLFYDTSILSYFNEEELFSTFIFSNYVIDIIGSYKINFRTPKRLNLDDKLRLSNTVICSLELLKTSKMEDRGSLLHFLNKSITPMGKRYFKRELIAPLKNVDSINERLDVVEFLLKNDEILEILVINLEKISDIERNIFNIFQNSCSKFELVSFIDSLKYLLYLKTVFDNQNDLPLLIKRQSFFLEKNEPDIINIISKFIYNQNDDALYKIINEYFNYDIVINYQIVPAMLEASKKIFNIKNIVQTYLEKFNLEEYYLLFDIINGFYVEIPQKFINNIPEEFINLTNFKKKICFNCDFLKEKSREFKDQFDILKYSQEMSIQEIFKNINDKNKLFFQICQNISELDLITSFSVISRKYSYSRPNFVENEIILNIKDGKHPFYNCDNNYISNDCYLDNKNTCIVITGPNMGGKSTFLRQNALIVIMSQMGCFIPATKVTLSPFLSLFTRIGSADSLINQKSTFLNEMIETAEILNNASNHSLCIIDELGRGTSSQEGSIIALETLKYLEQNQIFTLFATHHHNIVQNLDKISEKISHFSVKFAENNGNITILHKIEKQFNTMKSYPMYAIKLAGFKDKFIESILKAFEKLLDN